MGPVDRGGIKNTTYITGPVDRGGIKNRTHHGPVDRGGIKSTRSQHLFFSSILLCLVFSDDTSPSHWMLYQNVFGLGFVRDIFIG